MRKFLLTYIRPLLYSIGLYSFARKIFFFIYGTKIKVSNIFKKIFYPTASVLLYHRIDSLLDDPIKLSVFPKTFTEHIEFIKKYFYPISLEELSEKIKSGTLIGDEIAITFDDGYVDNLSNALPILEKYNIPAAIFITTSQIGRQASFEWDMQYSDKDRAIFLKETEIKVLAKHPLITIGAHTHSHPRLSNLSHREQYEEIKKSKNILESLIGKPVDFFAYPFGGIYDFNQDSLDTVQELRFKAAFSNTGELATKQSPLLAIPRINIRNQSVLKLALALYCKKILIWKMEDLLLKATIQVRKINWFRHNFNKNMHSNNVAVSPVIFDKHE